MLTRERLKDVLNYDPATGLFTWRRELAPRGKIGAPAGFLDKKHNRISIRIDTKLYLAHRLAWLHVHGSWPSGVIDHINGNASDNRIANLRDASVAQNAYNSRRPLHNKSGVKGVCFDAREGRWLVQVKANGKTVFRKHYDTLDAAAKGRTEAATRLHGEFVRTG